MSNENKRRLPSVRVLVISTVVVGILALGAYSPLGTAVHGWFAARSLAGESDDATDENGLELIRVKGSTGLRLTPDAMGGLRIESEKAKVATKERPLPPNIGTVNYDNDRLFTIRSRFPGELAEVCEVLDQDGSVTPTRLRPMRFGDKFKQGDLLAVIWSQSLGTAKAALVDAVSALRLSQDSLNRFQELYLQGAMPYASVKAGERQVQQDSGTLLTAERSLRMWKLTKEEIEEIKAEANIIHDQKKVRSADDEMRWARVEIRVPWFDKANPNRELVLVEKNTNINDMVDPIASAPLFKLADTSRLQIWVHPPEEFLPLIREGLQRKKAERIKWDVRFQSDSPDAPPRLLEIEQIAPSYEPNLHAPMALGYLPSPGGKYLIGQFVTATMFMPPEPDTVEVPTKALNEVDGQSFIFVENEAAKREYTLRRVAVLRRYKDVSFVRAKLTPQDIEKSKAEVARGRLPLEPLLAGERVVVHGVVELTSALESLVMKVRAASEKH